MSERSNHQPNKLVKGAVATISAAGLLATGAVLGAALENGPSNEYAVNSETSVDSASHAAELIASQDIANGHHLDVAEGVMAAVIYKDGSQTNVDNPIIINVPVGGLDGEKTVQAVAYRTIGSDAAELNPVTAHTIKDGNVERIVFFDEEHPDGIEQLDLGPYGHLDRMPLAPADGLSLGNGEGNYFVPTDAADQAFGGLQVGMATDYAGYQS